MKRWDALKALRQHLEEDDLVICHLGPTRRDWWDILPDDPRTFYLQGGMGMATDIGLGLALALSHRRVWAFEGDGALALNLNAMITVSSRQPGNLKHIVLSNRGYEAVGGQPVITEEGPDFSAIARAVGVANAYRFTELDDFESALADIAKADEYTLVDLVLEQGTKGTTPMTWDPLESKYRFARHIEATEGLTLLPNG